MIITLVAALTSVLSAAQGTEWSGPAASASEPRALASRVTYSPSQEIIPNPERGFFHASCPFFLGTQRSPLDAQRLSAYRAEGITLFRACYVLDEFSNDPISRAALDGIAADFAAVRQAGLKIIPRFQYSFPCAGQTSPGGCNFGITDIPVGRVLDHIDQLTPVLRSFSDVIAYLEMGMVGAWGEWHHSTNNLINDDATINSNSTSIVARLLSALPDSRMAALRYPYHKQAFVGAQPLDATQAYTRAPKARLAGHSDCFLANASDGNTYAATPAQNGGIQAMRTYVSLDSRFVAQGGETCSVLNDALPYIGCANALRDLALMHWSALNTDYQPQVVDLWRQQGCYPEIQKRLGYRFRMVDSNIPAQAAAGGQLNISFTVANDGFAAPYNPRDVELVLRNASTGRIVTVPVPADPRFWAAGETRTINVAATLPSSMDVGAYQVLLNLPDPESTLRNRPEYSIRFANTGLWEPSTGYNDLQSRVTIGSFAAPAGLTGSSNGSSVTLAWNAPPGAVPTAYLLEAGSAPGLADLEGANVGAAVAFSASGVPSGTYYVRVRALFGDALSGPSNELVLTVGAGCVGAAPPSNLTVASLTGGNVALIWTAAPGSPSSYVLEAGTRPGLSDLAVADLGSPATSFAASGVSAGTYYVRLRARNSCGVSAPSNELIITVR